MDKICEHYKIVNREEFYRVIDKKLKLQKEEWIEKLKKIFTEKNYFKSFLDLIENPYDKIKEGVLPFVKEEMEYLEKIVDYAKEFGVKDKYININISVVRGLEYYTDFVFETYKKNEEDLGSLASGGRYDNLIEL